MDYKYFSLQFGTKSDLKPKPKNRNNEYKRREHKKQLNIIK